MTDSPETTPTSERPVRRLRRGGLAIGVAIGLLIGGAGMAAASHDFPDVPNTNPFHDDIAWLADAEVTGGFPDGTYRPGDPVTRGSMAAFLRRLAGGDPAVDPIVDAATLDGRTADQVGQRWAAVQANGTLSRGSGVSSTAVIGTGYEVIFNRNVTTCSYQVTSGTLAPSNPTPVFATVAPRSTNVNGVFVQLFDHAGATTTSDFHVAVFC
jgi:hypothetical protein